MRALLIGLGGAGCRIVDTLNQHDERSGVRSVHSFIFDADQEMVSDIESIPRENRFVLTPVDPIKEEHPNGTDFEVGNLASCFQRDGIAEIDAVFVCAGLGGRMAELVPIIVEQLNKTFEDPVFAILTLPGRNEGVKISARASETLSEIRKVTQASILFDNETWFKRLEEEEHPDIEGVHRKSTIYEMYPTLNEMLARRVGLLLRAGEFNHKGVDAAEVVLDAGEVLNTLKEMDLVAIGYATEKLPSSWGDVVKKIRVEKYMLEENQARTSRIVELAKQAVYREVSVPCDLTSANKALVLIAGPSDELSMKGFQTVRKWIDRSIKGLEMRAGDYPVKSTQYVGVIIVLAGIENVPRVAELDEIKDIYETEQLKVYPGTEKTIEPEVIQTTNDEILFEEAMVMAFGFEGPRYERTEEESSEEDIFEIDEMYADDIFDETDSPESSKVDDVFESEYDEDVFSDEVMYTSDSDDVFEADEERYYPSESDDVFEDTVQRIIPPPPVQYYQQYQYYVPQYQQPYPQMQQGQPSESMNIVAEEKKPEPKKEKEMPKVNVGGPKKQKQITGDNIMLPKREKKEDNVLSGMADIGKKQMSKDSDMIGSGTASVGGKGRPKETEGSGVLEGSVNVKGGRPKETDGHIRMSGGQRPKETDGHIRMSGSQRPKETDGHIRMSGSQKPKEIDGTVRMAGTQKPKELSGSIGGGTSSAKPKELGDREIKTSAKQKPVTELGEKKVRVASQTPMPKNAAVKPVAKKNDKKWI